MPTITDQQVSIPVWYDWQVLTFSSSVTIFVVSIPVWYDWQASSIMSTTPAILFQFQFGTIGRSAAEARAIIWKEVSIPVWYDWQYVDLLCYAVNYHCFNSSLVRLAEHIDYHRNSVCKCFNSSLVRLAVVYMPPLATELTLFQFQFGTIGSSTDQWAVPNSCKVSIPVWYDWQVKDKTTAQLREQVSIPVWYDWQRAPRRPGPYPLRCFNSSLVRLAVRKLQTYSRCSFMFQFQFGTIGRISYFSVYASGYMFQFQFGTIGSIRDIAKDAPARVSIPVWYDWQSFLPPFL